MKFAGIKKCLPILLVAISLLLSQMACDESIDQDPNTKLPRLKPSASYEVWPTVTPTPLPRQ